MKNLNLTHLFQIDPVRTISAGKVNIGAFRTYPKVSTNLLPHSISVSIKCCEFSKAIYNPNISWH